VRWLIDEQLTPILVDWLQDTGQEALHVNHLPDEIKSSDDSIAGYAIKHNYIVISRDIDFIDLHVRKGTPQKLLFLDIAQPTRQHILELFDRHFDTVLRLFSAHDWIIMQEDEVVTHW